MKWLTLVAVVPALVFPFAARAEETPSILREVNFEQHLDEQVPLDLPFRDEEGETIKLGDTFQGKPVILVLAYYRCPMLCTQVLNGMVESLRPLKFSIGDEFNVVTVSFDAREQPELAAAKKQSYLQRYGRKGAADGWHFLTGPQASITALANAVGFRYAYDPKNDQFAHASGIMLLTPEGKLSRYFYGIRYAPFDLRLGLVEASRNQIGSPVEKVLLTCYQYDPAIGQYTVMAMTLVRVAGAVFVVMLGSFLLMMWRWERRRAREQVAAAPTQTTGVPST